MRLPMAMSFSPHRFSLICIAIESIRDPFGQIFAAHFVAIAEILLSISIINSTFLWPHFLKGLPNCCTAGSEGVYWRGFFVSST